MSPSQTASKPSVPRQIPRPPCHVIETAVAATFAVPLAQMRDRKRGAASVAFARQSAMYLAHVSLGLNLTEVARRFGRDRTTAAHACRLVEERRDDPAIDALLTVLETTCRSLPSVPSARVTP